MATTRTQQGSPTATHIHQVSKPDPYFWHAVVMVAAVTVTLPALLLIVIWANPAPPIAEWSVEAAALGVDRIVLVSGASTYNNSCAVCHGPEGDGVHSLGKPLRNSAFVQQQPDSELIALITDGRKPTDPGNTTGALMPARGAKSLDDDTIAAVVTYLRTMQEPGVQPVSMEPWNIVGRESSEGPVSAIEIADHVGHQLYLNSCAACHGNGAEGIDGLGLPLTTSGFILGIDDPTLIKFIKSGRASWDASNTTGIDMPPKGGNPAITDEQLQTIVDYLRALQEEAMRP
ncbi:MAG: hypothetical protein Phyf2KO_07550 [Phycisphaerales bacterium]